MTYVAIDDRFHSDPRILEAGWEAAGVYAASVAYCGDHLTNGVLPGAWVRTIASTRVLGKLTATGLWRLVAAGETFIVDDAKEGPVEVVVASDGYYVDGFLELNRSREKVEQIREVRREAGRVGGQAKRKQVGSRGLEAKRTPETETDTKTDPCSVETPEWAEPDYPADAGPDVIPFGEAT